MFGGKELQNDVVGGNSFEMYDYGARNYDASLGRWMNIDPLADKFYALSPYNFVANSPIILMDPDGKYISFSFTFDDAGNLTGINILVTGKLINDSSRKYSEKQMEKRRQKIIDGISNIKIDGGDGISVSVNADIQIAASDSELTESDHAFRLVDDVSKVNGANHSNPNTIAIGYAPLGENVVYLDKNRFSERTVAHEVGHSAGLKNHISGINERMYYRDRYEYYKYQAINGPQNKRNFYKSRAMNMSRSKAFGGNFLKGNLMHQSQTKNSSGQSAGGYLVTPDQLGTILINFTNGNINKGKQK